MNKITEIIPENMPEWVREAMNEGQLFNRLLDKVESQEKDLDDLKAKVTEYIAAIDGIQEKSLSEDEYFIACCRLEGAEIGLREVSSE